MTTLAIAQAIGRTVEPAHAECREKFIAKHPEVPWLRQQGDALVSRSRSIVATRFLKKYDQDVLVTIDSDIVFRADDVWKIAEAAHARQAIVGGVYVFRAKRTGLAADLPDGEYHLGDPDTPLVPARYVSTGFMATPRRVFEKLVEGFVFDLPLCNIDSDLEMYPFYQPFVGAIYVPGQHVHDHAPPIDYEYLSEDWAFIARAKAVGFECFADPSIRLGHIGGYMYTFADLVNRYGAADGVITVKKDGKTLECSGEVES